MSRDTRSDLLFALVASAVTYGLTGPVPATVVAVIAVILSVGIAAPASAIRSLAVSMAQAVRGGIKSAPSVSGVSVGLRWLVVVFLAGVLAGRGGIAIPQITLPNIDLPNITLPDITPDPPAPTATAATFVYEKDEHAVPGYVLSAFNKINRGGRVTATLLEADPQDGTGEVPDQYKAALAAAKQAGLPALVIASGDQILSVVKDTKDEQAVLDSVQ